MSDDVLPAHFGSGTGTLLNQRRRTATDVAARRYITIRPSSRKNRSELCIEANKHSAAN